MRYFEKNKNDILSTHNEIFSSFSLFFIYSYSTDNKIKL